MRLIATFDSEEEARRCFLFLQQNHIDLLLEKEGNQFHLWVKKEDDLIAAHKRYQLFLSAKPEVLPSIEIESEPLTPAPVPQEENVPVRPFWAPCTRFLLLLCLFVFWVALPSGTAPFPFTKTQLLLLYDEPQPARLLLELEKEYKIKDQKDLQNLPPEAERRLKALEREPVWRGFYEVLLHWEQRAVYFSVPLFSSILRGEVWRLVTPIFLHAGLLHIIFNMLWLWMLGRLAEIHMGAVRYFSFILLTALVTNTLQYLMTGFFFMGFSGVVCAFAGYIWTRKRKAPWELYPIDRATLLFLGIFVFGMLAIQLVAFFLQIFRLATLPMILANTAHISGIFLGLALGHLQIFTKRIT